MTENKLHLYYVYNTLNNANRLFSGAKISYQEFLNSPEAFREFEAYIKVLSAVNTENALIKIVKERSSDDFIHQLKDYSYRPVLRDNNALKEGLYTHKYSHTEKEIISYKSHKLNVKNKPYSGLKKQSTTLLGQELKTAVFGQKTPELLLVGYIFNHELALKSKGHFKYDRGTYDRKWVGTEESVAEYARKMEDATFNDIDDLRSYIRANPTIMTETLARPTRESCMAIVIARNSPASVQEARRRQVQIEKELNISLPIVFYDNKNNKIVTVSDVPMLELVEGKYLNRELPWITELLRIPLDKQSIERFMYQISEQSARENIDSSLTPQESLHNLFVKPLAKDLVISEDLLYRLKYISLLSNSPNAKILYEEILKLAPNGNQLDQSLEKVIVNDEKFKQEKAESSAIETELNNLIAAINDKSATPYALALQLMRFGEYIATHYPDAAASDVTQKVFSYIKPDITAKFDKDTFIMLKKICDEDNPELQNMKVGIDVIRNIMDVSVAGKTKSNNELEAPLRNFINNDLIPNSANRRELDQVIHQVHVYGGKKAKKGKDLKANASAILEKGLRNLADNYYSTVDKTPADKAEFKELCQEQIQLADSVLAWKWRASWTALLTNVKTKIDAVVNDRPPSPKSPHRFGIFNNQSNNIEPQLPKYEANKKLNK